LKLLASLAALVLCSGAALAQGVHSGSWQPLGCAPLPSMATAAFLSSVGIPQGATLADIQVSSQNVNYRDDGVAPTATLGLTIFAGTSWLPYSGNLASLQLIQTASAATGFVCFYK
jgi:hypothetical protein